MVASKGATMWMKACKDVWDRKVALVMIMILSFILEFDGRAGCLE
jgi:hypothetical protein